MKKGRIGRYVSYFDIIEYRGSRANKLDLTVF